MMNYKDEVEKIFNDIIKDYNYQVKSIKNDKIALVNSKCAIVFSISREGIDIEYICKINTDIFSYWMTNFICSRFTDKDRSQYGETNGFISKIESEFRAISSGLLNNWKDLLSGDKQWIDQYTFDRFGGKPDKVEENIKRVLDGYLI